MTDHFWRLPDSVDELLPPHARSLDLLRRQTLDIFHSWGFDYIEPPVVEYLDALLVASSEDMDLQTFKFVDRASGKLLGLRSDMTFQAVRVDAHSRRRTGTQRLCYAGAVVYANAPGTLQSRVPLIAGAEIFGEVDLAADAEVISLAVEVLEAAGIEKPVLVLGHVGIYQALVADLALDEETERALFQAIQHKAEPDIQALLGDRSEPLVRLPGMMGRDDLLTRAARELRGEAVAAALGELEALADRVRQLRPALDLRFDLAELAGYGYHSGPVFTAFHPDHGHALAKGGRYDGVGVQFGNPRPATGFDMNLKPLVAAAVKPAPTVWVPFEETAAPGLQAEVKALRASGDRVIFALSPQDERPDACDRQLRAADGRWCLESVG